MSHRRLFLVGTVDDFAIGLGVETSLEVLGYFGILVDDVFGLSGVVDEVPDFDNFFGLKI